MAAEQSKKQLIIDAQLLQTSDRNRGMGLFLVGLLNHLEPSKNLSLTLVTNSRLPQLSPEDQALIAKFNGKLVGVDLLHRGDNELFANSAATNRQKLNAALEELITAATGEVVYFIPALFSSEIHPVFPDKTTSVTLFHDLIPFLYYRHYFADHEGLPRKDYAGRFREFYKTDLFVTNSQTTADDLTVYFGVDSSRAVPILGAAADRKSFSPKKPAVASELGEGFVLMPSGDDLRKNNTLAAQAFAGLHTDLKLVITSNFSEGSKRALKEACPNVVFPGSVNEEEFLWLLDNAKVVFFPSSYEGLGMPILEAVERNALIVCSSIPVFAEISREAFIFFDPGLASSMAGALENALKTDKQKHLAEFKKIYAQILGRFSWENTAQLFLEAVNMSTPAGSKKRLAVFCPSPSSYSAIGKYTFEVHAELSRLFDIDYYAEEGLTAFAPTRPNILEYATNYYSASTFDPEKAGQYDYILYNLGNSEFHIDTILNALRLPANAIIHDTHLDGIFDWLERQGYLTANRRHLETVLDEAFGTKDSSCLVSLVTNQRMIVCHSRFAEKAIGQFLTGSQPRVVRAALPVGVPKALPKQNNEPIVSFAGIISEDKGIAMVSEVAKNQQVRVKVFGFGVLGGSPLLEGINNIEVTKDLSDKDFQDNLQQTDILVNYRPNYHGETSLSTLEAMRHGAVVIVRNIGWYSELPDDVVVKVAYEHEIVPAISKLLADSKHRQAIGDRARIFLQKNHSHKKYAECLAKGLS